MNPNAYVFVPRTAAAPVAAPAANPLAALLQTPAVAPAPAPVPTGVAPQQTSDGPDSSDSWESEASSPAPPRQSPPPRAASPVPQLPTETVLKFGDDDVEGVAEAPAAAAGLAQLSLGPAVDSDPREVVNVVFIGHVDAGKSTLSGQIMYLTGQVDERTIQKFEREAKEKNRESWFFAYIMDTNEEERAKGKTVEVGRAHFESEKKRYVILDAPGHKNYVPNMIGGAAQADVAILVISARRGEFETGFEKGGQTQEHARLVKTIGVKHLVVVINKMDDPTVGWSKERYDECVGKLTPFLAKQVGFNIQKDVTFLPVSGYTGANIKVPVTPEVCPWIQGTTLLAALDDIPTLSRNPNGPLRIPVVDGFKDGGKLYIMGKVESGTLNVGQTIYMMPPRTPLEVMSIFNDMSQLRNARAGENVRINIRGVEEENVVPGFVLCDTINLAPVTTAFECQMVVLELPKEKPLLTAGYEAIMHAHTLVEDITIEKLCAEINLRTGQETRQDPPFTKGGGAVRCRIRTARPICVEKYAEFAQLGRFTLRDGTRTIAFGKITLIARKKSGQGN